MTASDAKNHVRSVVSRETFERLELLVAAVGKWQPAINLVAPSTLTEIWHRHVQDSLQLLQLAPKSTSYWVDLGSGAGFPGLVCGIAASAQMPNMQMTLIESDVRKATFLRDVIRQTNISCRVLSVRAERAPPQNADVVSARALAPLSQLCALAHPHLAPHGVALFPKGRNHLSEQIDADKTWLMSRQIHQSETDSDAAIYRIGELTRA